MTGPVRMMNAERLALETSLNASAVELRSRKALAQCVKLAVRTIKLEITFNRF